MKKFVVGVVLGLLVSFGGIAHSQGRGEAQSQENVIRELVKNGDYQAAKKLIEAQDSITPKESSVPIEMRVVNNAREWASLGTNLGVALVATAKEVGVATAQFAETPLGRVTTAVVVYKVLGKDVIRTTLAILVFLSGLCLLPMIYKFIVYDTIEYEYYPVFWGAFQRKRVKQAKLYKSRDGSGGFVTFLGMLVSFAAIIGLTAFMLPS